MKENMTVSGTHDNEPWNFVESAMTKVQGFTKTFFVYFFYKRCEAYDEIDAVFQPFLDPAFVGDTTSLGGCNDSDDKEDGVGSIATTSTNSLKKQGAKVEKNDDTSAFDKKHSLKVR
ncbi:hypothetical protein MHU86_23797 [Fragilaria crotonensis]|nr:hypothetical protein MHU86_23797 [Fragilaria crotonensis]